MIEQIIESAGKPFFSFRDIDENRPAGAIRIRTETIAYFLARYQERLKPLPDGFPEQTTNDELLLSLRIGLSEPSPEIHVPLEALLASWAAKTSAAAPQTIEIRPNVRSAIEGGSRN